MGKLDEQLKELQKQKLKAEFLKLIKRTIGDITDDKFKEIEKEVKDDVFAFFDSHIDMIESGEKFIFQEAGRGSDDFNPEQKSILKKLADTAMRKISPNLPFDGPVTDTTKTTGVEQTPKVTADTSMMTTPDKISFALKHRNLGGKDVKIRSLEMASGIVKGIDAPNIVVQLKTGQYINVTPEDIII